MLLLGKTLDSLSNPQSNPVSSCKVRAKFSLLLSKNEKKKTFSLSIQYHLLCGTYKIFYCATFLKVI